MRWNYTDVLLRDHPERFSTNKGKFGLFTLKEIVEKHPFTQAEKDNIEKWVSIAPL